MSKLNSSVCLAALALALSGCATKDSNTSSAAIDAAVDEARLATLPATPEEIEAASRTDPLTRANFWSKEYEKNPANLETAIAFANALREIGSHDRVIDIATQTAALHPNSDQLLLVIGKSYLSLGQNAAATSTLQRAARLDTGNADVHASLGLAFDRQERHRDAQAAYRRALELEPGRTTTRSNFALSLALSSDLAGAETELRHALAQAEDDRRIRENLAMVLGLQGRFDEMNALNENNAPAASMRANETLLKALVGTGKSAGATRPASYETLPAPVETPQAAPTASIDDSALEPAAAAPAPEPRKPTSLRGSLSH